MRTAGPVSVTSSGSFDFEGIHSTLLFFSGRVATGLHTDLENLYEQSAIFHFSMHS